MIFSRKAIVTYKWVCIIAGIIYAVAAGIEVLQSYAATLEYSETPPQIYVSIFLKELVYSTMFIGCLLYTSPSPRDGLLSRMPSSA